MGARPTFHSREIFAAILTGKICKVEHFCGLLLLFLLSLSPPLSLLVTLCICYLVLSLIPKAILKPCSD